VKNPLKAESWSPYIVGTAIGILSWITFLIMFKALSITTAFVRISGFIIGIFSYDHISFTPYFAKYIEYKPVFEWQIALFVGIIAGSWISSRFSSISIAPIPYLWVQNFGSSNRNRIIGALIGGFLLLFGARLGGGCTLGHGVSGGLQLLTLSFLFIGTVFATGIITAHILYRKK